MTGTFIFRLFDQLINRASEDTRKALVEQNGINVFVPTTEAFKKISNVPWASLVTDIRLVDKVRCSHNDSSVGFL